MKQENLSSKQLQQRKFLMVLPLLILPFIVLIFWALGGGAGNVVAAQGGTQSGLNLKLPEAKPRSEKALNKLSFYQQATLDSEKAQGQERLDPYWKKILKDSSAKTLVPGMDNSYDSQDRLEINRKKVYDKLEALKQAMNKSQQSPLDQNSNGFSKYSLPPYQSSSDVDRLQLMMQKMKQDKSEDPEIAQLNNMLDKIQAIQSPNQASKDTPLSTEKDFTVKAKTQSADISLLNSNTSKEIGIDTNSSVHSGNAFYSTCSFNHDTAVNLNNAIEAIIPETQTIVSGATLKLVLSKDVTVQNMTLPSGSFIYGLASLSNERLKVEVRTVRFQTSILPVNLKVFDMDGQEGIYIPGSINRTVVKESANNAIGSMHSMTIDPSIGAEAASAGIEAAKTLFSKKVKLIKVTVKAGYKVLLKDTNNN